MSPSQATVAVPSSATSTKAWSDATPVASHGGARVPSAAIRTDWSASVDVRQTTVVRPSGAVASRSLSTLVPAGDSSVGAPTVPSGAMWTVFASPVGPDQPTFSTHAIVTAPSGATATH